MRNSRLFQIGAWLLAATLVPHAAPAAADPAKDANATVESAKAKQLASVAAMAESLAKQRASIHRQIGTTESGVFFELPPPPRLSPPVADCDPLPDAKVGELVDRAAKKEQLDSALVKSVMSQESGFRPCAVSPKGAMGLMQLMPETAGQFNVKDPFDPESNVNAGTKLLKQLLDRYNGSVEKALSAYNAGTGRVDNAAGVPDIPETIDYVRRILSVLPGAR